MRRFYLIVLLVGHSLVLAAVESAGAPLVISGTTMGTTYRLKLAEVPDAVDVERLEADVAATLDDIDRRMSTYRPDSEVCRFNRAAADEWFEVSKSTAEVVAAAEDVSRRTDGALDITIGPIVRLWHFGPRPTPGAAGGFVPPKDELISQVQKRVGHQKLDVRLVPPALRKHVAGLEIDLSAIAKGYAVDRLAELLEQDGVTNYLVDIGGEVRAAGCRPNGSAWRVGVEQPTVGEHELAEVIPLWDAAMATSGDYRKYFEHEGHRYSHIIDPSTGRPATSPLASATVVAEECMRADAWATALVVLGPERGLRVAEQNDIAALLISRASDGTNVVQMTSRWRQRFGEGDTALPDARNTEHAH